MPEFATPLFSTKMTVGRRVFFFDVRKSKKDKPYIKITESSFKEGQTQRSNLMIFDNEMDEFKKSLAQVFGFVETIK
ncbi:MAG: DUF3276 family protein [Acidobacteriaceae bacterium]